MAENKELVVDIGWVEGSCIGLGWIAMHAVVVVDLFLETPSYVMEISVSVADTSVVVDIVDFWSFFQITLLVFLSQKIDKRPQTIRKRHQKSYKR